MTIVNKVTIPYNDFMISYAPFWQTLRARGESTYSLIKKHGISSATIARMRSGGGISTMKIDDLCRILRCRVEDIIEYREEPLPPPHATIACFTKNSPAQGNSAREFFIVSALLRLVTYMP